LLFNFELLARTSASLLDGSKFAKFFVAQHAVGIVIKASENSVNVVATRVKTIAFKIALQVCHANRMVSARDIIEGPDLNKIGAGHQLALLVVANALEPHLLLNQAHKAHLGVVSQWLVNTVVG